MQNIFKLPENFDFIDTVEPGNIFRTLYFWPHPHWFHTNVISYTLIVLFLFFLIADSQI